MFMYIYFSVYIFNFTPPIPQYRCIYDIEHEMLPGPEKDKAWAVQGKIKCVYTVNVSVVNYYMYSIILYHSGATRNLKSYFLHPPQPLLFNVSS